MTNDTRTKTADILLLFTLRDFTAILTILTEKWMILFFFYNFTQQK